MLEAWATSQHWRLVCCSRNPVRVSGIVEGGGVGATSRLPTMVDRAGKGGKAARVLATLRAHCDRLELELRELDFDVEAARAMVARHGEALKEPCLFLERLRAAKREVMKEARLILERLRAAKAAKLHETEQSLFSLASSYDRGASLLTEMHPPVDRRKAAPWSTLKASGPEGRVTMVTTTSPILQFSQGGRGFRG
ncbi:hypothetical protein T484DRAFT_1885386 [Baffinella frigidus]|nr:hypothetical protein T484DRAFT_1885386 [Cryptophyta sp. CCMP2293]